VNYRGVVSASNVRPTDGDALILVDVQHDFLPGGSLGVADGDAIIEPLNAAIEQFSRQGLPVVATRDWHPSNHISFAAQGGPWPPHCVQGTHGAQFDPALRIPEGAIIISKASDPAHDAYSGFQGTDLDEQLRALGVRRVFVGGLATDYCVLNTVLDARRLGYQVVLLADAVRAVNVQPDDGEAALAQMAEAGAVAVRTD
jgi:nicotinamidase/pyrazinamidase